MQKIPPFMVSDVNFLSLRMNPPGIQYLLKNSHFTRVIWSILVILALMSAAIFATNIFTDWKGERTITSLKTISKPVTELDFPSVTICKDGQNMQAVRWYIAELCSSVDHHREPEIKEFLSGRH